MSETSKSEQEGPIQAKIRDLQYSTEGLNKNLEEFIARLNSILAPPEPTEKEKKIEDSGCGMESQLLMIKKHIESIKDTIIDANKRLRL